MLKTNKLYLFYPFALLAMIYARDYVISKDFRSDVNLAISIIDEAIEQEKNPAYELKGLKTVQYICQADCQIPSTGYHFILRCKYPLILKGKKEEVHCAYRTI